MDIDKVKEVFSDKEFVEIMLEKETPAQVQVELKKRGLDFSENDIIKMRDKINNHLENGTEPDELSLDQLDDVAEGESGSKPKILSCFLRIKTAMSEIAECACRARILASMARIPSQRGK